MLRRAAAISVAACMSMLAAAAPSRADETLDRLTTNKEAHVGFWNEPPFNFTENGEVTGSDIEVMRHVLRDMGITHISGVMQDFSTMIPGLGAKRFDLTTAFFITPARCKQVQFSVPIWVAQESFIVKAGNPKKLHSYEDVAADNTAKVGMLTGAVEKKLMQKVGVKENQIVTFNDQSSAMAALHTGRIDAFVSTSIGNQKLIDASGDSTIEKAEPFHPSTIDGKLDMGYGGFTFRSQDTDFVREFNTRLKAFLGTPEHLALIKPFGFTKEDITPVLGMTAETACKG